MSYPAERVTVSPSQSQDFRGRSGTSRQLQSKIFQVRMLLFVFNLDVVDVASFDLSIASLFSLSQHPSTGTLVSS
ncbi:hypothetical protein PLICRDRAFT_37078 [Plicaturopsis crispa FD-325 SS-3]|nr:hypothetical protein PLICRDRAFT_37078 [Plicaturopsis crispa FD-325 SS-3]